MIYATPAAKIKILLIFFILFSLYTCEYSFNNTITIMPDSSVQFEPGHDNLELWSEFC